MMLLTSIHCASTGASWRVLLDMAGTSDFSAVYP